LPDTRQSGSWRVSKRTTRTLDFEESDPLDSLPNGNFCHKSMRGKLQRGSVWAKWPTTHILHVLQSAQFCLSGSEQNAITTDSQPSIWPDRCCWPIGFRSDCVLFGLRPEKLSRLQYSKRIAAHRPSSWALRRPSSKKVLYPFLRRVFHPGPPRGTVVVVPTPLPFVLLGK